MFGRKKKYSFPAENSAFDGFDNVDDFDDFSNAASANEATGLIPGNNDEENAEEFYDDIFDYLPKGTPPTEKYR